MIESQPAKTCLPKVNGKETEKLFWLPSQTTPQGQHSDPKDPSK